MKTIQSNNQQTMQSVNQQQDKLCGLFVLNVSPARHHCILTSSSVSLDPDHIISFMRPRNIIPLHIRVSLLVAALQPKEETPKCKINPAADVITHSNYLLTADSFEWRALI